MDSDSDFDPYDEESVLARVLKKSLQDTPYIDPPEHISLAKTLSCEEAEDRELQRQLEHFRLENPGPTLEEQMIQKALAESRRTGPNPWDDDRMILEVKARSRIENETQMKKKEKVKGKEREKENSEPKNEYEKLLELEKMRKGMSKEDWMRYVDEHVKTLNLVMDKRGESSGSTNQKPTGDKNKPARSGPSTSRRHSSAMGSAASSSSRYPPPSREVPIKALVRASTLPASSPTPTSGVRRTSTISTTGKAPDFSTKGKGKAPIRPRAPSPTPSEPSWMSEEDRIFMSENSGLTYEDWKLYQADLYLALRESYQTTLKMSATTTTSRPATTTTTKAILPTTSNGKVDCGVCMETIPYGSLIFFTACKADHKFCRDCIVAMVESSLSGNSVPTKCCDSEIALTTLKKALPGMLYTKYTKKHDEATAPAPLFCPHQTCATLIICDFRLLKTSYTTCPTCRTGVCKLCKHILHPGKPCQSNGESGLEELAKESGWKKCPSCGRMIERAEESCNKMTCSCGVVFCWQCGKRKPKSGTGYEKAGKGGCDCPIFDAETVRKRIERRKAMTEEEEREEVMKAVRDPEGWEGGASLEW